MLACLLGSARLFQYPEQLIGRGCEMVLKHPDLELVFVIQTNTCDVAVVAVLLQVSEQGMLWPGAHTLVQTHQNQVAAGYLGERAFHCSHGAISWRVVKCHLKYGQTIKTSRHPKPHSVCHQNRCGRCSTFNVFILL